MHFASPFSSRLVRGRAALCAVGLAALTSSGCISWYAYDPAPHHGWGGFPPPEVEAPVPREGDLPIAPVALRHQGGTIDYRPAGARGLRRLVFYEKNAEVSPGAYVMSYSASRAQLAFGEGSLVVLHNRCTALVEDATRTGSLLYLSVLERVSADLDPAARIRLPGGALVGAAPAEAQPPPSAGEAEPTQAPKTEDLPAPLLELLKGAVPGRDVGGAPGAPALDLSSLFGGAGAGALGARSGGGAPGSDRLRFVATDFRAGRYVRLRNRGAVPLLVAHLSGDVILGPGECVDIPVLRGVDPAALPPTTALLASESADGLKVRASDGARLRLDGEVVEVESQGASGRAWAAGAAVELAPGERARVRPLAGAPLAR